MGKLSSNIINLKNKGFTMLELILVVALMLIVLSGIYGLFFFSLNSYNDSIDEANLLQESSTTLMWMDREIRQATRPIPATAAVELVGNNRLDIYTYINDDLKRVSYRIQDGALQKSINETNEDPVSWESIITAVEPLLDQFSNPLPYFQLDNKSVNVRFKVTIGDKSIDINNTYFVRSKGVI
ncbi:prepilin-type N-terminal cleavage/methylation domain-containing protein [Alkaliphilus pronyensis]|uniref:Prepilin-type N-terminal cleavage/methylation domain-containing protein n=1 Tax=Alkaliphilus pronyensis TaxID=1482732 RepID=A0A6I0FGL4_9FIRM|nr:prepilin-type N-terminal cleavage/methylation domain-containing protein [Alkaliphilus pronyensis]KAB3537363.1 prepilin-type N-terminal cleavage/methylation domain-containing protein [Alkaliphilus pronyensis]